MKKPDVILAIGVSHRDVELAALWLRWVCFLGTLHSNAESRCLIVYTKRAAPKIDALKKCLVGTFYGEFETWLEELPDENESGYPKSASHLFLRTLEIAERQFPGAAVLWCEPDTVPTRPTWFEEIADEYSQCGKPFLGMLVGTKFPHMSGNGVYPPDWRKRAPSIAKVLTAPDYKLWGPGKGQPWDVYCRAETTPQMATSKLLFQVWKNRDARATRLKDIPATAALFHQDKSGALIREIAETKYPEFMSTLPNDRRFFAMNGHPSRLRAKGLKIPFSFTKWGVGGHRTAVCSDELSDKEASALAAMVGQCGVREVTQDEFLKITGLRANQLPPPRVREAGAVEVLPLPKEETHSDPVSHPGVFVMLGRYGDICNILPMLLAENDAGRRPTLVVAKDFADILDGVSYVDRIVWEGAYDQLPDALRWLKKSKGIHSPIVCQFHRHPFDKARLTDSYQKEVWRLAGRLEQFPHRGPLLFDRRDAEREEALCWSLVKDRDDNPMIILVALESASSPIHDDTKRGIMDAIRTRFTKPFVVDLSKLRAERIYDLLSVYEMASCLVSADTVHLHLSRESKVPVIALLNDGWRGSVPNRNVQIPFRYSGMTADRIVNAIENSINGYGYSEPEIRLPQAQIYHAVDAFGSDARHHVAQSTWNAAYADGIIPVHVQGLSRDAKTELGDPRSLPFLKDILWAAIPADSAGCGNHIVVWTNADIGFAPGVADVIRKHVGEHGCASMRRTESDGDGHPGRDLFAFTVDWLHAHWDEFPDYVIGAPVFDLGVTAMIRKFHKLPFSLALMDKDMHPADMKSGFALHQSHDPEWQVSNIDSVPSVAHNKKLFRAWAKKYAPEIKFTQGGNLK